MVKDVSMDYVLTWIDRYLDIYIKSFNYLIRVFM